MYRFRTFIYPASRVQRLASVFIFTLLLGLAGVVPSSHAQTIQIDTTTLNFGIVPPGKVISLHLGIENPSSEQLNVAMRTSCECVTVKPGSFAVSPGGRKEVLVTVDTAGYRDTYQEVIFVQSNDPAHPYIPVTVTGRVSAKKKPLKPHRF